MKKIKISMVAAAFIIGIGGAVATNATTHKATTGTNLYWFDPSGTTYDQFTDKTSEMQSTGCPDQSLTIECVRGYSSSQLKNPADPSQGVKTTDVDSPQDIIHERLN